jgi:hypothetical protein
MSPDYELRAPLASGKQLSSSTVADLWNALFSHPRLHMARWFCRQLHLLSKQYRFSFKEVDAATGNDKLYAHFLSERPGQPVDVFNACFLCENHSNNLGEQHLLLVATRYGVQNFPLQSDLFCSGLFLGTGGNCMRLLSSTPCLRLRSAIKNGSPPPGAKMYSDQMKDLLVLAYKHEHDPTKQAVESYTQRVTRYR